MKIIDSTIIVALISMAGTIIGSIDVYKRQNLRPLQYPLQVLNPADGSEAGFAAAECYRTIFPFCLHRRNASFRVHGYHCTHCVLPVSYTHLSRSSYKSRTEDVL